jgi:alkanesulfonate monooxygenase SsuD/methylene tetrahydromethanopterin reductase-like flavin-dependent oxidoreductase (luciferase family)
LSDVRVLVVPPSREWPELRAAAIEAERIGFDGILVPDHLTFGGRPWLEALTTMAALAEATRTVELCFGVLSATFRPPAVLARAIDTLDRISSGRVHAGLGAGVDAPEHLAAGLPFGTPGERLGALERTILAIRDLCEDRVPIVIGASGDRALALVARYIHRPAVPFVGSTGSCSCSSWRRTPTLGARNGVCDPPRNRWTALSTEVKTGGSTRYAFTDRLIAFGSRPMAASRVVQSQS